jgi:hypothetical protein
VTTEPAPAVVFRARTVSGQRDRWAAWWLAQRRQYNGGALLLMPFLLLIGVAMFKAQGWAMFDTLTGGGVLGLVLVWGVALWGTWRRSGGAPDVVDLEFTPDLIRWSTSDGLTAQWPWSAVRGVQRSDRVWLLHYGRSLSVYLLVGQMDADVRQFLREQVERHHVPVL